MNKNTTILLGAIAVLAIGAGAYVTMSKSSQEGFTTQSVRSGTRSLVGSSTIQSKSTTTKTTTDTSLGVPTSNGGGGDALSCDTSTITSSLKLVSIKDSNTKTPQLEKGSTVTFRHCIDYGECTEYKDNPDYKTRFLHGSVLDNNSWFDHDKRFKIVSITNNYNPNQQNETNYNNLAGINGFIQSYVNQSTNYCSEFTFAIEESSMDKICVHSYVHVFGPNSTPVDSNTHGNLTPVVQCFNLNTQVEQAPNTPTAIGDSM